MPRKTEYEYSDGTTSADMRRVAYGAHKVARTQDLLVDLAREISTLFNLMMQIGIYGIGQNWAEGIQTKLIDMGKAVESISSLLAELGKRFDIQDAKAYVPPPSLEQSNAPKEKTKSKSR